MEWRKKKKLLKDKIVISQLFYFECRLWLTAINSKNMAYTVEFACFIFRSHNVVWKQTFQALYRPWDVTFGFTSSEFVFAFQARIKQQNTQQLSKQNIAFWTFRFCKAKQKILMHFLFCLFYRMTRGVVWNLWI